MSTADVGPGEYGCGIAACTKQVDSRKSTCSMPKFGTGTRNQAAIGARAWRTTTSRARQLHAPARPRRLGHGGVPVQVRAEAVHERARCSSARRSAGDDLSLVRRPRRARVGRRAVVRTSRAWPGCVPPACPSPTTAARLWDRAASSSARAPLAAGRSCELGARRAWPPSRTRACAAPPVMLAHCARAWGRRRRRPPFAGGASPSSAGSKSSASAKPSAKRLPS